MATAPTDGVRSAERTLVNPVEPSVQTGTPTELIGPRESGPLADRGVTAETRTWTNSGPTSPELAVAPGPAVMAAPRVDSAGMAVGDSSSGSRWLMLAAGLAIVFGVFGLGVGLEWWGPRANEDPIAASPSTATPDTTAVGQGTTKPEVVEPETTPATEVGAVTGETTGSASEGSSSEGSSSEGSSSESETGESETTGSQDAIEKAAKPAVDRTPSEVEFNTGDFTFVYVKVGTRELALEPKAKLELKPGRHKVELRKKPTDAWQSAGTIKIEAGKRYKVRMTKPAGLKLDLVG